MIDSEKSGFELDTSIFIQFADTIKQFYDAKASELQKTGASPAQMQILHFLVDHEGCNQQTLVDLREVQRSTISGVLNQMESNGLINRLRNKDDKRMIDIFLTEKGREIGNYVRDTFKEYCWAGMADFKKDELDIFIRCIIDFSKVHKSGR